MAEVLKIQQLHTSLSHRWTFENNTRCNIITRSALHVELKISPDMSYTTGDYVGVYPSNDPTVVKGICILQGWNLKDNFSLSTYTGTNNWYNNLSQ